MILRIALWGVAGVALLAIAGAGFHVAQVRAYQPGPHERVSPLSTPGRSTPNYALAFPAVLSGGGVPTAHAPFWAATPEEIMAAIVVIAAADPNTEIAPGDGPMLFVARSATVGWPDLVSVEPVGGGDGRTSVAIYSRAVFGHSDFGVNAERVARWIATLDDRFDRAE